MHSVSSNAVAKAMFYNKPNGEVVDTGLTYNGKPVYALHLSGKDYITSTNNVIYTLTMNGWYFEDILLMSGGEKFIYDGVTNILLPIGEALRMTWIDNKLYANQFYTGMYAEWTWGLSMLFTKTSD